MNLKEKYEKEVFGILKKEFGIKNDMAVPRVSKIVFNMGTQDSLRDKGVQKKLIEEVSLILGQKPQITPAKISVASFGIRAGMPVGLKATLRGKRMYDFLEKLIKIVLPRLRDFRGVSLKSFDKAGNYTLGFEEHTVFPEVDLGKIDKPRGFEVTIVTNAEDRQKAERLLELLGMPFEKGESK